MKSLETKIIKIKRILNTKFFPVGVKIIRHDDQSIDDSFQDVSEDRRFCYYVRQAAQGESFIIKNDNKLECKTPYFCLGFKKPKYSNFELRISPAVTKAVLLAPLNKFRKVDSVVFIVNAKQTMLLVDALRRILKKKIQASFGASMSICGEIVAGSIVNKSPSLSVLCFGARIFSEYKENELALGIPFKLFEPLYKNLKKIQTLQELELELKSEVK